MKPTQYFRYFLLTGIACLIFIIFTIFGNNQFFKSTIVCNKQELTSRKLSLLLNQASNKIGKLSCKLSNDNVSENGGWCSKISGKNSSHHATDVPLAKALSKYLKGKRVASFGDGPGVYKKLFINFNEVVCYDAFDGAPFAEETTNNQVKFLDLSVPIYHIDKYDWVISLEVAEHIPKQFENVFLDNIVRHAGEGIILSWAKIGQGGRSHVNNKNFIDVKILLEDKGFFHEPSDSVTFKNVATLKWLKDNINVFRKLK